MQERDLDLILLEQLHAADGFDRWLASEIGLQGFFCRDAQHSVSAKANAKWGETDVLAYFSDHAEVVAVLIEDKIAANFMDRQAERYHERARIIVEQGNADRYLTVLVAPSTYLGGVPPDDPWDRKISIEELRAWFAVGDTAHTRWRREALADCLTRLRPISPAPGREDLIRFSAELAAHLAKHHAPTLTHKANKGDVSGPTINYPGCSQNKMLWWKVATSQMALQLMGPLAGRLSRLHLPEGMACELASEFGRKCDYLVVEVPAPDFKLPLAAQIETVEAAMAAAYRLVAFLPEIETGTREP